MSARIHTYGAKQPTRDFYAIRRVRPEYGGGERAYFNTIESERQFLAMYTKHDPTCRWSYGVPDGAEVVVDRQDESRHVAALERAA